MPLHLDSIMNDKMKRDVFAWVLQECMDGCDSLFLSEDKKYFHIRSNIIDRLSGDTIGKFIYTLLLGENVLEIKDIDIVWDNSTPTLLKFNTLREGSSDSNEYYGVEVINEGWHLEIETVNRHVIKEDLIGTQREVFVSAFPFELTVYEDIDAFNNWAGFKAPVKIGDADLLIHGFSPKFTMSGRMFRDDSENGGNYSFILGDVVDFRDVEVTFGEIVLSFVLANLDTSLGVIPVGLSRETFDLRNLRIGSVIAMNADIKVDLAKDDDFSYTCK